MDILSLQQAKKAKKAMKALEARVGSNAPGSYASVKARIEELEAKRQGLQDKAHAIEKVAFTNGTWEANIELLDAVELDRIEISGMDNRNAGTFRTPEAWGSTTDNGYVISDTISFSKSIYSSNSNPKMKFPSPSIVTEFYIATDGTSYQDSRPKDIELYASHDDVTYDLIYSGVGKGFHSVANTEAYLYYKLKILSTYGAGLMYNRLFYTATRDGIPFSTGDLVCSTDAGQGYISTDSNGRMNNKFNTQFKIKVDVPDKMILNDIVIHYKAKPLIDRVSDLETKTAINLNKHNLKMNAVLNHSRYGLKDLLVDDFQDASGIDTSKSANHEFDSATKKVKIATGKSSADLITVVEDTSIVPSMIMVSQASNESPFAEKTADLNAGTFVDAEVVDGKIQLKNIGQQYVGYGSNIAPKMTASNMPSPYVVSASSVYGSGYEAWRAFNQIADSGGWITPAGVYTGWIQLDFGAGNEKRVAKYAITNRNDPGRGDPKSWVLKGSQDGINFVDLDARTGIIGWTKGERKEFEFTNTIKYRYIRLDVSEVTLDGGNYIAIGELEFMESILANIYSSSGSWESPVLDLGSNFKQIVKLSPELLGSGSQDAVPKLISNTSASPVVVSASSQWDATLVPWKAFNDTNVDGNDSWCSSNAIISSSAPAWLMVDFSIPRIIHTYAVMNRNSTVGRGDMKTFKLQGSNDGTIWTDLNNQSGITWSAHNVKKSFTIDFPQPFRYYRLYVTEVVMVGSSNYVSIGELELLELETPMNVTTATSSDGITFSSYQPINPDGTFTSPSARYVKVKVEVTGGTEIIPRVVNEFEAGESTQFEVNDKVVFDGSLKLQTSFTQSMESDQTFAEGGTLLRKAITKADWTLVESLEVM